MYKTSITNFNGFSINWLRSQVFELRFNQVKKVKFYVKKSQKKQNLWCYHEIPPPPPPPEIMNFQDRFSTAVRDHG